MRPHASREVGIDPVSENVLRDEKKIDGISDNFMWFAEVGFVCLYARGRIIVHLLHYVFLELVPTLFKQPVLPQYRPTNKKAY